MNQEKAVHKEFEQMLRNSRGILYKVCLAFTDRSPDSVNNLYQEIVGNLWVGWKKFRGESKSQSWVYKVALNTARTELRKSKTHFEYVPLDEHLLETLAEENDPEIELLYSLINQLPEDDKRLMLLSLDHLSQAEIADIVNCTEEAVRQRLYRIRQKLKQLYMQENEQWQ